MEIFHRNIGNTIDNRFDQFIQTSLIDVLVLHNVIIMNTTFYTFYFNIYRAIAEEMWKTHRKKARIRKNGGEV